VLLDSVKNYCFEKSSIMLFYAKEVKKEMFNIMVDMVISSH